MKTLLRLLNLPESADLIELNAPKSLDAKMLELAPLLQISLTKDASKTSLKESIKAVIKTLASHTLFLVFSVLCILVILSGCKFLFSAQNWQDLEVWLTILLMAGFCISLAVFGYKIANRAVRATSNPLHSTLQRFETGDMDERWSHFFDWAKERNLVIYFKLASSEYISVPVEIWKKDFVVSFIFGSKQHRGYLVHSSHDYLESIVIRVEDWKHYEATLPKVDQIETPTSQIDKINNDYKPSRPAPSFNKVETLAKAKPAASNIGSKRTTRPKGAIKPVKRVSKAKLTPQKKISQSKVSRKPKKLEKPHARTCLRFVMMCEDRKYLLKYKEKEIKPHLFKLSDVSGLASLKWRVFGFNFSSSHILSDLYMRRQNAA